MNRQNEGNQATERIDATLENDVFLGRMNDPTSAGIVRGPCGDEMEFYLYIKNGIIEDVKYYTDGCIITRTCGQVVAARAKGLAIAEALAISPAEIISLGKCLPAEGRHCAILAVSTLYRAIADYLLRP